CARSPPVVAGAMDYW
nr:immunoglobulin heavy chain junction region [Mus musculus]